MLLSSLALLLKKFEGPCTVGAVRGFRVLPAAALAAVAMTHHAVCDVLVRTFWDAKASKSAIA